MRKYLFIVAIFFIGKVHAQIVLPELENINSKDSLSKWSYYNTYLGAFDFIISLRPFSNWGSGFTTALGYNKVGWHKIEINTSRFFRDTSISEVRISTIKKGKGDSLFQTLKENHLFDMQDERVKKMPCDFVLFDGAEYEFEIITRGQYKKLYFYAPEYYDNSCPGVMERKWIINCLKAFGKYLGR